MRFLIVLALLLAARPAVADGLPDRTERVIAAGKLWAQIKFFHPYLAYKPIDWDAALIAAIPKLEAATTRDAYRKALEEMIGKLGDPVTRVSSATPYTAPAPSGDWLTTPAPNIVQVEIAGLLAGGFDYVAFMAAGKRIAQAGAKAKVLVIDGRAQTASLAGDLVDTYLVEALPAIDHWPLQRAVEHHGWRTQEGMTSGDYYSQFAVTGAKPAKPAGPFVHVVFIADARTSVPAAILGLQMSGRATIVAPAPLSDESIVSTTRLDVAGIEVQVRLGELLTGAPAVDVRVPEKELRTRALAIAKTKLGAGGAAKPRPVANLPHMQPRDDNDYPTEGVPSRELRMLAGIRAWAVLDRFFPYRYLIADWDKALRIALPKLEAATDRDRYLDALRELGARAGDGHIGINMPGFKGKPRSIPAIALRIVEGKLAVHRVLDKTAAKGVAVGEVIELIDGRPARTWIAEKRMTVSASTDDAKDQNIAMFLLAGDDGSKVNLQVRAADNLMRAVELERRAAFTQLLWTPSSAPHWKKLPNNIGYVDLRLLTVPEVEPMFKELGGTKAIVFDMRGYPNGTAWSIAPRVNTRKATHGAAFLQPYVVGGAEAPAVDMRIRFIQPIPPLPPGASIYKGKVVVLIDDRAISQAEHTCLFLQETAGATFVGTPTAGANGDVTQMRLPGGLRMSFTGQEVRHLDGKQLQKLGIQPHLKVAPTLAGLRAGKDEVLDRALGFLTTGK